MTFQMALRYYNASTARGHREATIAHGNTHLGLYVEVLKVKRMLPNVNAEDGDVRQERVLVHRRHDLERLALDVVALRRRSASTTSKDITEHVRPSPNRNPG